jgi:hypothetical protein
VREEQAGARERIRGGFRPQRGFEELLRVRALRHDRTREPQARMKQLAAGAGGDPFDGPQHFARFVLVSGVRSGFREIDDRPHAGEWLIRRVGRVEDPLQLAAGVCVLPYGDGRTAANHLHERQQWIRAGHEQRAFALAGYLIGTLGLAPRGCNGGFSKPCRYFPTGLRRFLCEGRRLD